MFLTDDYEILLHFTISLRNTYLNFPLISAFWSPVVLTSTLFTESPLVCHLHMNGPLLSDGVDDDCRRIRRMSGIRELEGKDNVPRKKAPDPARRPVPELLEAGGVSAALEVDGITEG